MKKLGYKLKKEMAFAESHYDFSRRAIVGLILFPLLFLAFQILLTFPNFSEYKPIFWGENKPLENIQFIIFFAGAIVSLRMAWLTKAQMEERFVWGLYLLFSLVLFFIAMEEIAWGQQFLDFRTPDAIRSFNVQNEFTLHNVEILQDRTDFLNFIFGVLGMIGLWLTSQKKYRKVGIPRILFPWFILIFLLSTLGVFIDFFSVNAQFDYSVHKQTETVELLIAGGALLYILFNLRVFTFGRSRWMGISDVSVSKAKLEMIVDGKNKISVPLERYPWLENAPEAKRQKWQIDSEKHCVQWPELENSVCLEQLLESSVSDEVAKELAERLLGRGHFYLSAIAASMSLLWLILIPADPKNALLFGYSGTRLAMIVVGAALLLLFVRALQKTSNDPTWYSKLSKQLHTLLVAKKRHWFSLFLALVGLITSTTFLVIAFTQRDPYIKGFLERLAPWVFLGLVTFAQLLFYVLQKNMKRARTKLALATKVTFSKDHISLVLSDKRHLSLPITLFPPLAHSSKKEREDFELVAGGLRIRWPISEGEYCVQQFLAGIPSFDLADQ